MRKAGKRKWLRRLVWVLLSFIILIAAGWTYQTIGVRMDMKDYEPPGRLYEVDGGRMHVFTGGEGEATVVFASGWGTANPYVDFMPLYERLRARTKVAVYDRFGYGYSDGTDKKRDVDAIVEEIRQALTAAGQRPPYVLVGHSLGSLETIRYAQKYPGEVKGIVLIDGGSPEYYESRPSLTLIPFLQGMLVKSGAARLLYRFDGFEESMADQRNGLRMLSAELRKLDRVSTLMKTGNRNMIDEIRRSRDNARLILQGQKPLDVPLTVLTADYMGKPEPAWQSTQAALPSWSVNGKQIVVPDSSHYIHHYRPDLVADEILALAYEP